MRQEMMGFGDGSGISWTICKQSASRFRQITTPTPHHSIFTGGKLLLTSNQHCQMTEGKQGWSIGNNDSRRAESEIESETHAQNSSSPTSWQQMPWSQ